VREVRDRIIQLCKERDAIDARLSVLQSWLTETLDVAAPIATPHDPSLEPITSGTQTETRLPRLQKMFRDGKIRGREQKRIAKWARAERDGDIPSELEAPQMADEIIDWLKREAETAGKKKPPNIDRENFRRACREFLIMYRQK
jgi:hypothetical protein